jgi:4'-phosphopantetheinyl transferase
MARPLAPGEVHLWQLHLDKAAMNATSELLDEAERVRAARFLAPRDRQSFLAVRSFVRRVLSNYLQVPAAEIRFGEEPQGRPTIIYPEAGVALSFSLSHCATTAFLAVAHGAPIGVDVEHFAPIDDLEQVAGTVLSPEEAALLLAARVDERPRLFLRGWTRKEAILKALGVGLFASPEILNVPLAERGRWRVVLPDILEGSAAIDVEDISEGDLVAALAGPNLGTIVRRGAFLPEHP